jgi:hypothetical protein
MLRPQTWYLLLAAVAILVCILAGAGTTLQLVLLIAAALAALAVIPKLSIIASAMINASVFFMFFPPE